MPTRPIRAAVTLALAALVLGACSYTAGESRPAGPAPTAPPALPRRAPVIGTLPPVGTPAPPVVTVAITEPEAPPETTVPEETVASTAPAPTAAPQPVTTKRAAKPATTAPKKPPTPPSASTSAPRTASSFGVQAGAFTDPNGAKTGLATITAAGFSGFRIVGTGPYKVVRTGMTEADARALAARIRAAGYQSFVLT